MKTRSLICAFTAAALSAATSFAAPSHEPVAVYSRNLHGYTRTRAADGSYAVERYSFIEGQRLSGLVGDPSIDTMPFLQVAKTVSHSLAAQNYLPARNGQEANLLIVLSWGTTTGAEGERYGQQMAYLSDSLKQFATHESNDLVGMSSKTQLNDIGALDTDLTMNEIANNARDLNNWNNAGILGYRTELRDAMFLRPYASTVAGDIISDVEENRYFVVLKAYDFQRALHHKQFKELWETRFSVPQFGNRFDEQLPVMAKFASQYFGKDSGRLIRRALPNVRVDVGTPRVVESPK